MPVSQFTTAIGSATSSTQQTGSRWLPALRIRAVHGPTWRSRRQQRHRCGRRRKHLPVYILDFSAFLASQPSFFHLSTRTRPRSRKNRYVNLISGLEPSTSNFLCSSASANLPNFWPSGLRPFFSCMSSESRSFGRPAAIRLIVHRLPPVGRNVRGFVRCSFAPRIESEFSKAVFPFFLF